MAKDKRPALQFYVGDWMKDPDLRACSYAARGLWIDMLCLMYESPRRGYLLVKDRPASLTHIARMTGGATDEAALLLKELEDAGVFSRTGDTAIYCRRMVRDEQKAQKNRENGAKGGNPRLVDKSDNPPVIPTANPPDKGRLIRSVEDEDEDADGISSLSSESTRAQEPFEQFFNEYPADKRPSAMHARLFWFREGLDQHADAIMAALRRAKTKPGWVTTYAPRIDRWLGGRPWEAQEAPPVDPKARRDGETDVEYALRMIALEESNAA
jgi:hypothetical protein